MNQPDIEPFRPNDTTLEFHDGNFYWIIRPANSDVMTGWERLTSEDVANILKKTPHVIRQVFGLAPLPEETPPEAVTSEITEQASVG